MKKYFFVPLLIFFFLHPAQALFTYGFGNPYDQRVEKFLKLIRSAIKSRDMNQSEFVKIYNYWWLLNKKKNTLTYMDMKSLEEYFKTLKKFPGLGQSKKREEMKKEAQKRYNEYFQSLPPVKEELEIRNSFYHLINIKVVCKMGQIKSKFAIYRGGSLSMGIGKCVRTDFKAFIATFPSRGIVTNFGFSVTAGLITFKYDHDRFAKGLKIGKAHLGSKTAGIGIAFEQEFSDQELEDFKHKPSNAEVNIQKHLKIGVGLGDMDEIEGGGIIRISPKFFDFDPIRMELGIPKIRKSKLDSANVPLDEAAHKFMENMDDVENNPMTQSDIFDPDYRSIRDQNTVVVKKQRLKEIAQLYVIPLNRLKQSAHEDIDED